MPTPIPPKLVAEIEKTCAEIEQAQARLEKLYAKRIRLFRKARSLTPPVSYRALGAIAKVSDVAILQSLKRKEGK